MTTAVISLSVRRATPRITHTMPAISRQRHRAGNLPAGLTSFVGRRRETAEIKRLFRESRLVSLTGVGGAGKTRLALHVAGELQRAFHDGIWFVELAALDDEALLSQTIARTLGLQDRSARWTTHALAEYLADRELLLVLDNCEHLREACAVLTDMVLRHAPRMRVLATSRQPLGLTGEYIFRVPTMSVPAAGGLPPLESLSQYEAVGLFTARANAVRPDFELNEENAESVVQVCQRLDGLPLAIELAAARLRALSIAEIAERIENRYALLNAGSPGEFPRHQTLRALIDWSHDLCTEEERSMWARLSVFSGGFDLAAAEAVRGESGNESSSLLDTISALVDKSIVIAEERQGHTRYRMLEIIREYGVERLRELGLETELRDRHLAYFARVVADARAAWFGPDQVSVLAAVLEQHSNIRAALDGCLAEPGRAETGLAMTGGLWFLWLATGQTTEGRRWLERLLDLEPRPSSARVRALWVCAYLCVLQEDVPAAERLIGECREQAEQLCDHEALAWAEGLSGMTAMSQGRLATARRHLESALTAHKRCDNGIGVLDVTFYLGATTALEGHATQAAQLCEEALAMCDARGERWLKSYLLWDLGLVAWELGDSERAAAAGREALQLARMFDEQWAIAFCIELLAWTAHADQQPKRAARLLGSAEGIWRRVGAPLFGMQHLVDRHRRCLDGVQQQLGEGAFGAGFSAGMTMDSDSVTGFALEEEAPAARRSAGVVPDVVLTRREMEVAALVSEGLSNRQIAATLVISQRTAEAHVGHILGKLGFCSRSQVAAWVASVRAFEAGRSTTTDPADQH